MRNPLPAQTVITSNSPFPSPPPQLPAASLPLAVTLPNGLPVLLTLAQDIPSDATAGDSVRFKVAADVTIEDALAIHKGATATGAIVDSPKKVLGTAAR